MIGSVLSEEAALLTAIPLRIDPDEVVRFHAYRPGPASPAARYAEVLAEAERLIAPRLVYRAVRVIGQEPALLALADGTEFHIPDIHHHWGPIEALGVGLVTVGEGIEVRVRELEEAGEALHAGLLESAGSAAVECLAEWANDALCLAAIPEGLRVTNRISPGYAGWALSEQPALFRLCPGGPAGIALSSAGVMSPAKTISFAVGIGPVARVDHYFVQCRRCWAAGCPFRRAAATVTVGRA